MKKLFFSVLFLVAILLKTEADTSEQKEEELGCDSTCDYTLKMLNKMTKIESEIREAIRCLTEQVRSCSEGMYVHVCMHPCLFALRYYGPFNPMGSCRARSVYLTTLFLGRISPLSC